MVAEDICPLLSVVLDCWDCLGTEAESLFRSAVSAAVDPKDQVESGFAVDAVKRP